MSFVRITSSLFTKPFTGTGGCSSKAGEGRGRKMEEKEDAKDRERREREVKR